MRKDGFLTESTGTSSIFRDIPRVDGQGGKDHSLDVSRAVGKGSKSGHDCGKDGEKDSWDRERGKYGWSGKNTSNSDMHCTPPESNLCSISSSRLPKNIRQDLGCKFDVFHFVDDCNSSFAAGFQP